MTKPEKSLAGGLDESCNGSDEKSIKNYVCFSAILSVYVSMYLPLTKRYVIFLSIEILS